MNRLLFVIYLVSLVWSQQSLLGQQDQRPRARDLGIQVGIFARTLKCNY